MRATFLWVLGGGVLLMVPCSCGARATGPQAVTAVVAAEDHWDTDQDHRLASAIRAAFGADPQMGSDAVQISIVVKDADVQLLGIASTMQVKGEAGVRARWLAGIDRVDNLITVPSADPDPADAP